MKVSNETINSYLSFNLDSVLFAINVSKVINIQEMTKITTVPQSPHYMKGVINLRGDVLPVVDMRIKFGLPEVEYTSSTCILVLEVTIEKENVLLGAIVDSVQEVFELEDEQIQAPPNIGNKYKSEFIYGVTKMNNQFVMLIDIDVAFSSEDVTDFKESLNQVKSAMNIEAE